MKVWIAHGTPICNTWEQVCPPFCTITLYMVHISMRSFCTKLVLFLAIEKKNKILAVGKSKNYLLLEICIFPFSQKYFFYQTSWYTISMYISSFTFFWQIFGDPKVWDSKFSKTGSLVPRCMDQLSYLTPFLIRRLPRKLRDGVTPPHWISLGLDPITWCMRTG
jgi:hypothetical protein